MSYILNIYALHPPCLQFSGEAPTFLLLLLAHVFLWLAGMITEQVDDEVVGGLLQLMHHGVVQGILYE